jgi:hypothetical protein
MLQTLAEPLLYRVLECSFREHVEFPEAVVSNPHWQSAVSTFTRSLYLNQILTGGDPVVPAICQDHALSLIKKAACLEALYIHVRSRPFPADSRHILEALQIERLRSLVLPLSGESPTIVILGSFVSLVNLCVRVPDTVRFDELDQRTAWTLPQLEILEWRIALRIDEGYNYGTIHHASFLSRCRFPRLRRVSIEDDLSANAHAIPYYDSFLRAHTTIHVTSIAMNTLSLLPSIRSSCLCFPDVSQSYMATEELTVIEPVVQDIIFHAYALDSVSFFQVEKFLRTLHRVLAVVKGGLWRISIKRESPMAREAFLWDGGWRSVRHQGLVDKLLPWAAKFKVLGIDFVDEHGMSPPLQ